MDNANDRPSGNAETAAVKIRELKGHTPGPWHVEADPCHYDSLTNIAGPDDEPIAMTVGEWGPMVANARLIAAAPELLAMAQRAEAVICEMARRGSCPIILRGVAVDMRTVIARAIAHPLQSQTAKPCDESPS